MKDKLKRLTALILVFAMSISLFSENAWAAGALQKEDISALSDEITDAVASFTFPAAVTLDGTLGQSTVCGQGEIRLVDNAQHSTEFLDNVVNSIQWISSDESIVKIDGCSGVHSYDNTSSTLLLSVIPLKIGTATITGNLGNYSVECSVTITDDNTGGNGGTDEDAIAGTISFVKCGPCTVGQECLIEAEFRTANGNPITDSDVHWVSSDSSVVLSNFAVYELNTTSMIQKLTCKATCTEVGDNFSVSLTIGNQTVSHTIQVKEDDGGNSSDTGMAPAMHHTKKSEYGGSGEGIIGEYQIQEDAQAVIDAINYYFKVLNQQISISYENDDFDTDNVNPVDELMKADKNLPSPVLSKYPGASAAQYRAAYTALAALLDKIEDDNPVVEKLEFDDYDKAYKVFIDKVLNKIKTYEFYQEVNGYLCYVNATAAYGRFTGSISVSKNSFNTIVFQINSSVEDTANTMFEYYKALSESTEDLLKQSVWEYIKAVSDITGIGEIGKEVLNDMLSDIIDFCVRHHLGNVVKYVSKMRDINKLLSEIAKAKDLNTLTKKCSDLNSIYNELSSLDLSDDSVKDKLVSQALSSLKTQISNMKSDIWDYMYHPEKFAEYSEKQKELGTFKGFLKFIGFCPISITVYDTNNNILAVSSEEGCEMSDGIYAETIGEKKVIYIPYGIQARVVVTATDNGTMDFVVEDFENGISKGRHVYYDVPLSEGQTYTQTMTGGSMPTSIDSMPLNGSDGSTIVPDHYISASTYAINNITCKLDAGGSVYGAGEYVSGDRAMLTAIPDEGYIFSGWYENGELLSIYSSYSFCVDGDHILEAKFIQKREEQTISCQNEISVSLEDDSFQLDAVTSGDGEIVFYSQDETIAVVDDNGFVTPQKEGTTIIYVCANGTDRYRGALKEVKITIENAASVIASGTCGENLTWTLDDAGKLVISGSGEMEDYKYYQATPWEKWQTSIKSVEIKSGVTTIGEDALRDCSSVTKIVIPDSVKKIGRYAFSGCWNLISAGPIGSECNIELGWVTEIPREAFSSCASLTSVIIPDNVTIIGDMAFNECHNLVSVCIPNSVTKVGHAAFNKCSNLTSVNIPDNVTYIDTFAFAECISLNGIVIPAGVTAINNYTFYHCSSLSSVTISDNVTSLGGSAFENCSSLTHITIPDSVTSISFNAFAGCNNLISAGPIGSGCNIEFGWLTQIPDCAFSKCDSLTNVTIPEGVTNIGQSAFSECSSLTSVTIPEGVTYIGDYAFNYCESLTHITIPDSVTSIGFNAFANCNNLISAGPIGSGCNIEYGWLTEIPDRGFSGCTSLNKVIIPESITGIKYGFFSEFDNLTSAGPIGSRCNIEFGWSTQIPDCAFSKCDSLTNVTIPEGVTNIGQSAFSGCSSLTNVTIPDSVMYIGDYAFNYCESLTDITIPDSVTYIGDYAFNYCESLTDITIPNRIDEIDDYVFYNCSSLTSIIIPDSVTSIGNYAFENCSSLTSIIIPGSVIRIGSRAFSGCNNLNSAGPIGSGCNIEYGWLTEIPDRGFSSCTSLTKFIIPESLTSIRNGFFSELTNPTSAGPIGSGCDIEFGWSTQIPDYAFSRCDNLTNVTIPEGVTNIGQFAFSECSSLTNVTIPEGVTNIGQSAFSGCSSLTNVTIPDSVKYIGDYAFKYCESLTDITIPNRIDEIDDYVFYNCSSLTSIIIPDSVTSIGNYAFENCSSLTSITIPGSVIRIGSRAFSGCNNLNSAGPIGSGCNIEYGWLTEIPDRGFSSCTSLTKFIIPESLTSIRNGFFSELTNPTSAGPIGSGCDIEFGWSTQIPDYAFSRCDNLTNVTIPEGVTNIGQSAFSECSSLTNVTIPDSVTYIGDYAFKYCESLTDITIPESVTDIGCAFFGCGNLSSIYFEGYVSSIDRRVFYNVTATAYYHPWCSGWTEETMKNYGGTLSWEPYGDLGNLISVSIKHLPDQCEYAIGEEVNLTGLVLNAEYDSGYSRNVYPEQLDFVDYDFSKKGKHTVIVSYGDKNVSFEVTVVNIIAITVDPSEYPESDHNYADGSDITYTYNYPGAKKLVVQFSASTAFESNYDYLTVTDGSGNQIGRYSGTQLAGITLTIPDDTVNLRLTSDVSVNKYGFSIDQIIAYVPVEDGSDSITITSQPVDYVGSIGDDATFTVAAVGENLTYQWYYSNPDTEKWAKTSASGNQTDTITVAFQSYRVGQKYRCEITDGEGNSVVSDSAALVLEEIPLVITQQPIDYYGAVLDEPSFIVKAEGNGLTYQWYVSSNNGETWAMSYTPGYNTDTLMPVLRAYRDGYQYRCKVTDAFGNSVTSDPAVMSVKSSDVVITKQPADVVGDYMELYTFTVAAEGENLTYQWYVSSDGGETWVKSELEGYNTDTMKCRMYPYRNGYQYRCEITSGQKNVVVSDAATLTLTPSTVKLVENPKSVNCVIDETVQFHVEATGENLSYQWYLSSNGGESWSKTELEGCRTDTLTVKALAYRDDNLYRCQITDKSGAIEVSGAAKLTARNPSVKIAVQPESASCMVNDVVTLHVGAEGNGLTYQWYVSQNGGESWSKTGLTGATSDTLTVEAFSYRSGNQYRCEVTDDSGTTEVSDAAVLTVIQ